MSPVKQAWTIESTFGAFLDSAGVLSPEDVKVLMTNKHFQGQAWGKYARDKKRQYMEITNSGPAAFHATRLIGMTR